MRYVLSLFMYIALTLTSCYNISSPDVTITTNEPIDNSIPPAIAATLKNALDEWENNLTEFGGTTILGIRPKNTFDKKGFEEFMKSQELKKTSDSSLSYDGLINGVKLSLTQRGTISDTSNTVQSWSVIAEKQTDPTHAYSKSRVIAFTYHYKRVIK